MDEQNSSHHVTIESLDSSKISLHNAKNFKKPKSPKNEIIQSAIDQTKKPIRKMSQTQDS